MNDTDFQNSENEIISEIDINEELFVELRNKFLLKLKVGLAEQSSRISFTRLVPSPA